MMAPSVQDKYQRLLAHLRSYGRLAVAYSGGVDSTWLLYAAKQAVGQANVLALMATGSFMTQSEYNFALANAHGLSLEPVLIAAEEFLVPGFVENSPERCYHCKRHIFAKICEHAAAHGFPSVVDGSNSDDAADYRPGRRALSELGIASPLSAVGLSKADIRVLSAKAGLPTADYPSRACLASRIPYGTRITPELLEKVGRGEEYLIERGFVQVRLRAHGNIAIIEVPPGDFARLLADREQVCKFVKSLGFSYVTLDILGFRSGSQNEVLTALDHK